jgi:hypothetical protein
MGTEKKNLFLSVCVSELNGHSNTQLPFPFFSSSLSRYCLYIEWDMLLGRCRKNGVESESIRT